MKYRFLAVSLLAATVTSPAMAERHHVAVYGGVQDVLDDKNYAQFGLEYRFADVFKGLRPTIGINSTEEGDVYGYGGVNWDIHLGDTPFVLTPNFMVGAYHQGGGKDLGGAIEFRSGIEASYEFEAGNRLGVTFNHISNASIYDKNPGAEALLVVYQHPIDY